MNNKTINAIFAFFLLITPLTSGLLHANQRANNASQKASLKALIVSLATTWGSLFAHELGHARTASFIKPGSVHDFHVGFMGGYVMFDLDNVSPLAKAALYADAHNIDLKEIKGGARVDILLNILNLLAFTYPAALSPTGESATSDGSQILKALQFPGNYSHLFQEDSSKVFLWNATLIACIYAIHKLLTHTAQEYKAAY